VVGLQRLTFSQMAEFVEVPQFSQGAASEDEDQDVPIPKRRCTGLSWMFVSKSEADYAASDKFKSERWHKKRVHQTHDGEKVYFECAVSKKCPAGLMLLYYATSVKVSVFKLECDHIHNESEASNRGLPPEVRSAVKGLLSDGIRTTKLVRSLRLCEKRLFPRKRVNSSISRKRFERTQRVIPW
jgi:hypothetical protein